MSKQNGVQDKTFYLIKLRRVDDKLYWAWDDLNDWKEIVDFQEFLNQWYPETWHSYIRQEMGLKGEP